MPNISRYIAGTTPPPIAHRWSITLLTDQGRKVLEDVLSFGVGVIKPNRPRVPPPNADQIYNYCNVVAQDPREEVLQKLLENDPSFLTGLLGGPDNSDISVIFKPAIGNQHIADFAVLQVHQGGAVAHLVEIETSRANLFTKQGRTSQSLNQAKNQIRDWKIYVNKNQTSFAKYLLNKSMKLPLFEQGGSFERGFRLMAGEDLEKIWTGFGGLDSPIFSYTIVIGRWSNLSRDDKSRLLQENRDSLGDLATYTYEQVARGACFRLERDDWFNDYDAGSSPALPCS